MNSGVFAQENDISSSHFNVSISYDTSSDDSVLAQLGYQPKDHFEYSMKVGLDKYLIGANYFFNPSKSFRFSLGLYAGARKGVSEFYYPDPAVYILPDDPIFYTSEERTYYAFTVRTPIQARYSINDRFFIRGEISANYGQDKSDSYDDVVSGLLDDMEVYAGFEIGIGVKF